MAILTPSPSGVTLLKATKIPSLFLIVLLSMFTDTPILYCVNWFYVTIIPVKFDIESGHSVLFACYIYDADSVTSLYGFCAEKTATKKAFAATAWLFCISMEPPFQSSTNKLS